MKLSELYIGGEPRVLVIVRKVTDEKKKVYCKITDTETPAQIETLKNLFENKVGYKINSSTELLESLEKMGDILEMKMMKKVKPKMMTVEGHEGVLFRLSGREAKEVVKAHFESVEKAIHSTFGTSDGMTEIMLNPFDSGDKLMRMTCETLGIYIAELDTKGEYQVMPFDRWIQMVASTIKSDMAGFVYQIVRVTDYLVGDEIPEDEAGSSDDEESPEEGEEVEEKEDEDSSED